MTAHYFLSDAEFAGLLSRDPSIPTVAAGATGWLSWVESADDEQATQCTAALRAPRAVQSAKGFVFPATESLGRYGSGGVSPAVVEIAAQVVVGIHACGLRAQQYTDRVLTGGDFTDPAYRARREATTIISCDCVDCAASCFCTEVGGNPYPTEGFDVNLTPLDGGVLAEAATDRGTQWLGSPAPGAEATDEQLARRDALRKEMTQRVSAQNPAFGLSATDDTPPSLPNDDDPAWQQFAADCVECGACTNICPTCHCFYLYDQASGPSQFERVRTWDSCLLGTYHRMAGGVRTKLTPRPLLRSRLANRVLHKFVYSPQQYGLLGCVGCGRCLDGCLGEIDIRKVAGDLSQ